MLFQFKDGTFAFYLINSCKEVLNLCSIDVEDVIDYTFSFDGRSILFNTKSGIVSVQNPLYGARAGLIHQKVQTMKELLDILALLSWKLKDQSKNLLS